MEKVESVAAKPIVAPGCYGTPSVFSHDGKVCKVCPAKEQCSEIVAGKLKSISKVMDVSDFVLRHRNAEIEATGSDEMHTIEAPPVVSNKPAPQRRTAVSIVKRVFSEGELKILDKIPKKPRAIAERLILEGHHVTARKALLEGANPFPLNGRSFLHVTCKLLLSGGFKRTQLRDQLVKELSWSLASAASHVSMAIAILVNFGVISENKDGAFTINKENLND